MVIRVRQPLLLLMSGSSHVFERSHKLPQTVGSPRTSHSCRRGSVYSERFLRRYRIQSETVELLRYQSIGQRDRALRLRPPQGLVRKYIIRIGYHPYGFSVSAQNEEEFVDGSHREGSCYQVSCTVYLPGYP